MEQVYVSIGETTVWMFNHLYHMKMLLKARHKDESWERSLDQKLDFHIQSIRFGPPFNLSGTRTELDAWNCLPGGTHWGRPPTLFSATMLRRHSKLKAQSCSGVALLLCFNVAARPAAPLTCRLVRLGASQTRQRPAKGRCAGGESVLHQDGDHTGGLYILTDNKSHILLTPAEYFTNSPFSYFYENKR